MVARGSASSSRCPRRRSRHLVRSVRRFVRGPATSGTFVTVVIPERADAAHHGLQFLRHREAFLLKTALLFEPGWS